MRKTIEVHNRVSDLNSYRAARVKSLLWARLFPIGVDLVSEAVRLIEKGAVDWKKQDERFATWEPSWDRPRLKRNELVMLGGGAATRTANPCKGCERECNWCTYYIADPEVYGRQ